jgi:hypothetical protein
MIKSLSNRFSLAFFGLISSVLSFSSFAFDTTAAEAQITAGLTAATTLGVAMLGVAIVLGVIRIVRNKAT